MKKPIVRVILGCILALTVTVSVKTFYQFVMSDNVLNVNGIKVEMPTYNYEYNNYTGIPDIAEALELDSTVTGKRTGLTSQTVTPSNGDDDISHPSDENFKGSTLPSLNTELEPEQESEYLKLLSENGVNVSTENEFMEALETANVIIVKKNITLRSEFISLRNINVLVIDEGITLTVTSPNFIPECIIVNLGEILVADNGRMIFYNEPDYNMIGKIRAEGRDARICFNAGQIKAADIANFLNENSIYNTVNIVASSSDGKFAEIIIDKDITIPVGKTLWINDQSVLHVNRDVTLINNGTIICYNKPVVEGSIYGIGKQIIY